MNEIKRAMTSQSKYWAVMPAAGVGSRMAADKPKQYLRVAGKTIIEHSIDAILRMPKLESVLVCVSDNDDYFTKLSFDRTKVISTLGGKSRAESVLNGLHALRGKADKSDWVLVHDAARPCLQLDELNRLVSSIEADPVGGILALPAKDTIKMSAQTSEPHHVDCTLDRSRIWMAQTPQMFRYGLLLESLEFCKSRKMTVTDEASAVEQAGHSVKLVRGSSQNIKVTTPEDRKLVQFLLSTD